jgi:hypothetical protein
VSEACGSGCHQRDRHLSDCPCADPQHEHGEHLADQELGWADCPNCPGCLPRLAAPGLAVCPGCERAARDGLAELPDLWVDLAERPRLAGVSKAPTSEGETPDPMSDPRRQERSAIKAMLVSWCLTLAEDHRIGVPNEAGIAAVTRRLAAWHSDQARQNRDAALLLAMPTIGPLVRDPEGAAVLKLEEARHARAAQAARDDRETGRDILRAICEHITRHADRLLSGEHAEQLVSDLKGARSGARGLVFTSRGAAVRVRCTCGEQVALDASSSVAVTTCRTCGASGDRAWWVTHTAPDALEPMPLPELHGWLTGQGLHLTLRQVRRWADAGHLVAVNVEDVKRGVARTYDAIVSLRVAEHLLSLPRQDRGRAA